MKKCAIVFISIASLFVPAVIHAASLRFSPSTLSRTVGSTFSVSVYVSSVDEAINAASGVVTFPKGLLEVVGVSKANSVMNLWVQEPSFSNANGTVNFEGIALNPGFKGNTGNIVTITFRARSSGQATVRFSSGSVLANDGAGTDVLNDLGTASFSLGGGDAVVPEVSSPDASAVTEGEGPVIRSSTHPDQAKWYSDDSPEFAWELPEGALEVRTLIGTSPTAVPSVSYAPPISSKKVEDLSDGTYYFSLQIRTAEGWGDVARYRVNIDTTPPTPFSVTFPHGTKGWEPQPVILFNTTDKGSGVSAYNVKIDNDNGPPRTAPPADSNPYPLPPQYPGEHTVTVIAMDEAGNTRSASETFVIEAIDAPVITYYQEEIQSGDIMKVRGITYANSDITLLIRDEDGEAVSEEYTRSNSLGDWSVVATKRLTPGAYTFTARVTDGRGAKSDETAPLSIVVNSRFVTDFAEFILTYLSAAILGLLSLAVIIAAGAYAWYRSRRIIRRLRYESREAENMLEKSFNLLRKDINEHVVRLKAAKLKRRLTKDEVAFLERFEEELTEAERLIAKEVEDISHS